MLKELPVSEEILNTDLVKEYKKLINNYEQFSKEKEKKINDFLSDYILKSEEEILTIQKDIIKDFNKEKNLTYLRTKELERQAKENNLMPIFITLTNPSEYHPFITSKDKTKFIKLNPNFNFLKLEDSVDESYSNVVNIFRELYKNIKVGENKNMTYIRVVEAHKSLVCHLHRILYINKNTYEKVEKQFNKIKQKYSLKECKIEKLTDARGSSYIIKYILKNYKSEEIHSLVGYKKKHKIVLIRMSNLQISTQIFKKLYYSNKNLNEEIIKDIKNGVSKYYNLYNFYIKNTTVKKITKEDNKEDKIKLHNYKNKKRFLVFIENKKIEKEVIFKKIVKFEKNILTDYRLLKINKKFLQEFYERKDGKNFKRIYKIQEKNKNKYIINVYLKTPLRIKTQIQQTINFKIFDTQKQKEIFDKNNFKMIKVRNRKAA